MPTESRGGRILPETVLPDCHDQQPDSQVQCSATDRLVDVGPRCVSLLIGHRHSSDHLSNAGEMLIEGLMVSTEGVPGQFPIAAASHRSILHSRSISCVRIVNPYTVAEPSKGKEIRGSGPFHSRVVVSVVMEVYLGEQE